MVNGEVDQQLLTLVTMASSTIADAAGLMQKIDDLLPSNDGLKWFNRLYQAVTDRVRDSPPSNGWKDEPWLTRLDVVFAGFYFKAVAGYLQNQSIPNSWTALFEVRHGTGIDRIQFALAGMNAHINHDLALALLQTDSEFKLSPTTSSPEHDDFEHVNGLLEAMVPAALGFLATGILGEAAQDTGKIGRLLALWNVRAARDLAWDFCDHLRDLDALKREIAMAVQDKLTGVIGRSILLPL